MLAPCRPSRLLALVVVTLAVAACTSSDGDDRAETRPAPLGEVFVAQDTSEIDDAVDTVIVPGRRYDIVVGDPREAIDLVTADEAGIAPEAAEGTRFVGVAWQSADAGGDAVVLGGEGPDVSPRLSLVVDGETVAVGPLDGDGPFARWVVVPDGARRIGFAVEFDGVTQVVEQPGQLTDPSGGPALLYDPDPPGLRSPECPEPEPEDGLGPAGFVSSRCEITVSDPIPYHRDLGWADDGRAWVVVDLWVGPLSVGWIGRVAGGGNPGRYEVDPTDVEVTLDGGGPVDVVASNPDDPVGVQDDDEWRGEAVYSVPDDVEAVEVAFARPYDGRPEDPDQARAAGAPDRIAGTYAASFTVEVG